MVPIQRLLRAHTYRRQELSPATPASIGCGCCSQWTVCDAIREATAAPMAPKPLGLSFRPRPLGRYGPPLLLLCRLVRWVHAD